MRNSIILHSDSSFVALSKSAIKLLGIDKNTYSVIFVYKKIIGDGFKYALFVTHVNESDRSGNMLNIPGSLVIKNKLTKEIVFENKKPTNQMIFYDMGFGVDKGVKVQLKKEYNKIGECYEYIFHKYEEM